MNIKHKYIEEITITGKYEESEKAFAYCAKHGYHITRSGPRRINAIQVDVSRFKIIAERPYEHGIEHKHVSNT